MNYWLFTVMYDEFPRLWPTLVKRGLAAQAYPPGQPNEVRNINVLRDMKRGDGVIAALMRHRFSGYGFLKSDFYQGSTPLGIKSGRKRLAFENVPTSIGRSWTLPAKRRMLRLGTLSSRVLMLIFCAGFV